MATGQMVTPDNMTDGNAPNSNMPNDNVIDNDMPNEWPKEPHTHCGRCVVLYKKTMNRTDTHQMKTAIQTPSPRNNSPPHEHMPDGNPCTKGYMANEHYAGKGLPMKDMKQCRANEWPMNHTPTVVDLGLEPCMNPQHKPCNLNPMTQNPVT
ncbi:hypothetical protein BS47DRAFT_1369096 [Hydnum rufescens UP504]|uniref:Uncharacterized protein n=1 Tax=Hydnum rufescens UP504 TaxID=1448309 RepID=A0A9P6DM98_9AGAM|nr:hypothetical protein BS47DRAFT_1369096 [Hydnum rufescens UP504]